MGVQYTREELEKPNEEKRVRLEKITGRKILSQISMATSKRNRRQTYPEAIF